MFNLPDKYKVGKKIPMKDFIPKDLKPDVRKKIKDSVNSVYLTYQIMGEDIPSLINSDYNCQVIQFYDFELTDIKKASVIANIYQEVIKSPCVIRFYDTTKEIYSFAMKRLNQNDNTQIIVTDKLLTDAFVITSFPNTFKKELNFNNIKNNRNKYIFYFEMFVRAYILTNDKLFSNIKDFLKSQIWYNENKVKDVYSLLTLLADKKEQVKKSISNAEKMKLNGEIREILNKLKMEN